MSSWLRGPTSLAAIVTLGTVCTLAAQAPAPPLDRAQTEALAKRAAARMQALQREADSLAKQEHTLLVELQRLEVERQLREEELKKVTAEAATVTAELEDTGARIRALEQREEAERPGLEKRLLEIYKLGRGGYLRLLMNVDDLRSAGRAYRTVSALAHLDRERVEAHRRSLNDLRAAFRTLEERSAKLATLRQQAQRARAAADHAATARADLITRIDQRRDLNAQLAGELQAAQQKLQASLSAFAAGHAAAEPVSLPLRPFQGDLAWPVAGPVLQRYGRERTRFGTEVPRNGLEIGGDEGATVAAIHEGTVAFADAFSGFGNLVIVDHGAQAFSLYGHLGAIEVTRGARVERGQPLGLVGASPTGPPSLYFELRIDAKPVDPLQWLRRDPKGR